MDLLTLADRVTNPFPILSNASNGKNTRLAMMVEQLEWVVQDSKILDIFQMLKLMQMALEID